VFGEKAEAKRGEDQGNVLGTETKFLTAEFGW
jgi:hypothetical protein